MESLPQLILRRAIHSEQFMNHRWATQQKNMLPWGRLLNKEKTAGLQILGKTTTKNICG
jgi:hypothetical protein